MKKILASLLAITMILTTMSACIIPAQAEDVAAQANAAVKSVKDDGFIETFEDYGAGGMKMMIDITTSKANSLYAEAEAAMVNGTTVTTHVAFTNPEVEDMEVLCFIAVYGKYNEMIGCHTIKEIVPAGKKTENIPVSITTRKSDIGYVKMFVWNNEKEMNPYHNSEELFNN